MGGLRFVKGHGTGNDFVLLIGAVAPTRELVAAICDRRTGIGGDGVIVVAPGEEHFMDYRNADGSLAELCGNGIRVFARYLVETGLEREGEPFLVLTRAGERRVRVEAGEVDVELGGYQLLGAAGVRVGGRDFAGNGVGVGNPHLVVRVDDLSEAGPLTDPPEVDGPGSGEGVNVEFVQVLGPGKLAMRVHERGVGETSSCGTGACAAAVAATAWPDAAAGEFSVDATGGRLRVTVGAGGLTLSGPAVLVAEGVLRADWVAGLAPHPG